MLLAFEFILLSPSFRVHLFHQRPEQSLSVFPFNNMKEDGILTCRGHMSLQLSLGSRRFRSLGPII